jgi:hypothetical protein
MDGELWMALYSWVRLVDNSHSQDPRKLVSDAAVMATYFWSVLHTIGRSAGRATNATGKAYHRHRVRRTSPASPR